MSNAKPIPFVRNEVLKQELQFPQTLETFKRMKTEKLEHYEAYYHDVLEALAGSQVWTILDALEYIATVIKDRKASINNTQEKK